MTAGVVGVEGLASNKVHWKTPDHDVFVNAEPHDPDNMIAARALMLQMELKLASNAPHDLIFLDGSFTTALIHMYKAIDHIKNNDFESSKKINDEFKNFLLSYKRILNLEPNDSNDDDDKNEKIWIAIPKYTSRNDIGTKLSWDSNYDDKAILSLILEPGEFTIPTVFANKDKWHEKIPYEDDELRLIMQNVIEGIKELNFLYYKPYSWTPAIRIEVPSKIAEDDKKLSSILFNVKTQSDVPTLMEPYPLYMADRMVKNVGQAVPSYRQIVTRRMVQETDSNFNDIFFIMHSYRTESNGF